MDLELKQKQSQVMTQKMLQSVAILQMNSQELTGYINELALENPFLEVNEHENLPSREEQLRKLEWINEMDEQNRIYTREEYEEADSDVDGLSNLRTDDSETLTEHLMGQLTGAGYTEKELEIFEFVAECLDSRGYYTGEAKEIADRFHLTVKKAEKYLSIMRSLEPVGVCAANLEECLLMQLAKMPEVTMVEEGIVSYYLEILGKNQLQMIAQEMKQPLERIVEAKERIKSLNPKPSSGFATRQVLKYLQPDVTVLIIDGGLEIVINDNSYPAIHVNKEYVEMLRNGNCPKEVQRYINEKVTQIESVQNNISRRNKTLYELTECLAETQSDFFFYGKGNLNPLLMKEAAEKLGVHESTISRTVRDKYLQCQWGLFPFSYFFTKGAKVRDNSSEREKKMSSTDRIYQRLKDIVNSENKKKPLSDQLLSEKMEAEGIHISRRTITKYREILGIPDCRGRKEY